MFLFFCLHSLYAALRLVSFKHCASKWSYNGVAGWSQALADLGFTDQFLLSFVGLEKAAASESTSRFLPTPSCSLLAMLVLLARWGYQLPTRGGMRDSEGQRQSKLLFGSLIACSGASGEPWHLTIAITHQWACRWPRPTCGEQPDFLPVDGGVCVDLTLWRDKVESVVLPRGDPLRVWWKVIEAGAGTDNRMKLADLIVAASRAPACKPLLAQLIWCAAPQAQEVLLKGDPLAGVGGRLVLHGASDFRPNPKAGDFQLARYIEAGASQIGQPLQLSLVSDKAQVKGLNLSNCIAVTSDSLAVIFPPQVAQSTWPSVLRLVWGVRQPPPPPPIPEALESRL